ncbi:RNA-binding protein [Mycolicibacterium sp. XJ870]
MRKLWASCAAALLFTGGLSGLSGLSLVTAPSADAICGSIGGRHVDVTGCSDPLYELNDALAPPPPPPGAPPPPPGAPPPPPPAYVPPSPPNITVCANVGRRISISGCV